MHSTEVASACLRCKQDAIDMHASQKHSRELEFEKDWFGVRKIGTVD